MRPVPEEFLTRPFHRSQALAAGITPRVLEGRRFRRIHEAVYRHRDHDLTFDDAIVAARLALPASARTTGITRLQQLGIDHGPRSPLHFVVEGDHHLQLDGVFLHRTVKMPPHDEHGVSAEAALVACCAEARTIDAIKVGSLMLRESLLDLSGLDDLLIGERWRRGTRETTYVLPLLEGRCRSMPEAELFAMLLASGLPVPEVNQTIDLGGGLLVTPDLWFRCWRCAVEYEGSHHQEDRNQYVADLSRYTDYRRTGVSYVQVTSESMRNPRQVVRAVHRALLAAGYDGPAPDFGPAWTSLFTPLRHVVRQGRGTRR